jgi:hypothetical protein
MKAPFKFGKKAAATSGQDDVSKKDMKPMPFMKGKKPPMKKGK